MLCRQRCSQMASALLRVQISQNHLLLLLTLLYYGTMSTPCHFLVRVSSCKFIDHVNSTHFFLSFKSPCRYYWHKKNWDQGIATYKLPVLLGTQWWVYEGICLSIEGRSYPIKLGSEAMEKVMGRERERKREERARERERKTYQWMQHIVVLHALCPGRCFSVLTM